MPCSRWGDIPDSPKKRVGRRCIWVTDPDWRTSPNRCGVSASCGRGAIRAGPLCANGLEPCGEPLVLHGFRTVFIGDPDTSSFRASNEFLGTHERPNELAVHAMTPSFQRCSPPSDLRENHSNQPQDIESRQSCLPLHGCTRFFSQRPKASSLVVLVGWGRSRTCGSSSIEGGVGVSPTEVILFFPQVGLSLLLVCRYYLSL